MKTNINPSAIYVVLILMAVASLFTMFSVNQINYIVHGDLYNFNLQFSYRWAMPYWVFSGIIFGLSWMNIALSIIVTLYIFKKSREHPLVSENISQTEEIAATQLKEEKKQLKLSEYVEPQKEELTDLNEETTETSSEEFIKEENSQPGEAIQEERTQTDQKENEELHIPAEDTEQRQSIL